MKIEIKNRWNSNVIHAGDYVSIYEAISGAIKAGANLYGADLRGADLYGADLYGANLRGADLYGADLYGANLRGANLHGVDLRGAGLRGVDLHGVDLRGARNAGFAIAQTRILPEGEFIGWKKLRGSLIAKIRITESSKRSHAFGRKCRCSEAVVVAIYDGDNEVTEGFSMHDTSFKYVKGEIVNPKQPFSEDWQNECASGIHFFITRIEAENY